MSISVEASSTTSMGPGSTADSHKKSDTCYIRQFRAKRVRRRTGEAPCWIRSASAEMSGGTQTCFKWNEDMV